MSFSGQWKRYGCCPLDSDDMPQPPGNMAVFYVTGYNYRTIPEWANVYGRRLIPVQFSADGDKLLYRWTFYKPYNEPLCKMTWFLSTSDDIVPNIYEWITNTEMTVSRVMKYNGYTLWKVTC